MAHVTLVKKIRADGTPCRKCRQVLALIERDGLARAIDRIVVADERDPASEGMRLARRYRIVQAPFFVVEGEDGVQVHTIYFRLRRQLIARLQEEVKTSPATC